MRKINNPVINFFVFFLLLLIILILGRILLPHGDEADFEYRVTSLLESDHPIWTPYYYIQEYISNIDWLSPPTTILPYIIRITLTFGIIAPLIFNLVYIRLRHYNHGALLNNTNIKINSILITLIFPSIWFHLGVLAEEQLVLSLTLLAVFNLHKPIVLISCAIFSSTIDAGNTLVFLVFLMLYRLNTYIRDKFSIRFLNITIFISIAISYIFSMKIFSMLEIIPIIGDKVALISDHYTSIYEVNDKYSLFLRPVITFMGMVLLLPNSQTFFIIPYILCALYMYRLYYHNLNIRKNRISLEFLTAIQILLCSPMILPGFSNAKYYVFLIPIFIRTALEFYSSVNVFKFTLICNIFIFVQLLTSNLIE